MTGLQNLTVLGWLATVCKAVRPDRCLSVLSVLPVCNVGVGLLWPKGWMDQDETWHAGRPRPWPHCVRRGPDLPPQRGTAPQFSAHICCGQMAAWIKMPVGMEVGLGSDDFVFDRDQRSPTKKGAEPPKIFGPCLLRPNGWMHQDATWMEVGLSPGDFVLDVDPGLLPQKGRCPLPNFRPMSIVSKRLDGSR